MRSFVSFFLWILNKADKHCMEYFLRHISWHKHITRYFLKFFILNNYCIRVWREIECLLMFFQEITIIRILINNISFENCDTYFERLPLKRTWKEIFKFNNLLKLSYCEWVELFLAIPYIFTIFIQMYAIIFNKTFRKSKSKCLY